MSTVTNPAPANITTLQGIEAFAEETGQDFFDLLMQRLDVLHDSTPGQLYDSATRQGISLSAIVNGAEASTADWVPRP